MMLFIECVIICILMWLICYLGTGSDEKNFKYLNNYPNEVKEKILNIEKYKHINSKINKDKDVKNVKDEKIKEKHEIKNNIIKFISNLVLFTLIIFIFGIFIKEDKFINNFINLVILGEILNLFDLIVIDLIWWRNSKRIRFKELPDKKYYLNPKKHIISFYKGIIMFLLVAIIDGFLLTIL